MNKLLNKQWKKTALSIIIFVNFGFAYSVENLVDQVDVRMGTDDGNDRGIGHIVGQTTYGPQYPWGTANPGPQSQGDQLSTTGFRLDCKTLDGITQNHVSGTGVPVYGHLLLRPLVNNTYDSTILFQNSVPGLYTVILGDSTKIEATATQHACLYRITYGRTGTGAISINLKNNMGNGTPVANATAVLSQNKESVSGGANYVTGWSNSNIRVSYYVQPSKLCEVFTFENLIFKYAFPVKKGEQVFVRLALSFTTESKAKQYVTEELPDLNFDTYSQKLASRWNYELSSIIVSGGNPVKRSMFYTAYYHSMMMPHDRTGDNHKWNSAEPYWDDQMCVWDTWRTLYPLMMLTRPDMVRCVIRSFIDRQKFTKDISDTWVAGNRGPQQGGVDPINVIADAYIKGLQGLDWKAVYDSLKKVSDIPRRTNYEASTGIENAYNDFCVSLMGAQMNDPTGFQAFKNRSTKWQNYWTGSGFCGACYEYFNGYNFFVPHDIAALIQKYGGKDAFSAKLENSISGNGGALKNEPNFLMYHTFHYNGQPDRSSYWVRKKLNEYQLEKHVYPGDEDSGAMGSWFMFSSMGIFPNAGQDIYLITAPIFSKTVINLPNGKTFAIESNQVGDSLHYIASATLNGKPYTRSWIRHSQIMQGGTLSLQLATTPSSWGTTEVPPSVSTAPDSVYVKPIPVAINLTNHKRESPAFSPNKMTLLSHGRGIDKLTLEYNASIFTLKGQQSTPITTWKRSLPFTMRIISTSQRK